MHARGRYDETIVADVSPERLQRYFVKRGDFYTLSKDLRVRRKYPEALFAD